MLHQASINVLGNTAVIPRYYKLLSNQTLHVSYSSEKAQNKQYLPVNNAIQLLSFLAYLVWKNRAIFTL